MDALLQKTIGSYRYEVFYDTDYSLDNDGLDSDYQKEIETRLETGSLNFYGIVKSKMCECCKKWTECDSIWGVLDETAHDALDSCFNDAVFGDENE